MLTQQELTAKLGRVLLFCGVETVDYGPGNFANIAGFCRAHNIDTILVKIADGGNLWYGGWAGVDNIRTAILSSGIGFVPYAYCYGNKFGALQTELDIAHTALEKYGYFCMDMEAEYDGHTDWANTVAQSLTAHPGILLCSTWADPQLQNWTGVMDALKGTYDAFMPQEYTNYLDGTEGQLRASGVQNMVPTIYLGADMPGNNALQVAQDIHARGHSSISLWYDGFAINNPSLVDQIAKIFATAPAPVAGPNPHQLQQFSDVWVRGPLGKANNTTGIYKKLVALFLAGKIAACFPLTDEYPTVNWSGVPISYQSFSTGIHAEWDGAAHVYDALGHEIV